MDIKDKLMKMKDKWEHLDIEEEFPNVHHFSSDKFEPEPSPLKKFYNYCQDKDIQAENIQTVNRALKTASLFEKGSTIKSSIVAAWAEYPLINR